MADVETLDPALQEVYKNPPADLAPGQVLAQPPEFAQAVETPADAPIDTPVDAVAGMPTWQWILIGAGVVLVLWVVFTYNALVRGRLRVREAWSDIDVQLKRRYSLIPNLVETVKGYMTHEREVLENVTKARAAAIDSKGSPDQQGKSENMLTGALKTLFAVAENYPDLKANQNFLELQRELVDAEDKIQAARRFYNGNVRDYNMTLQVFPNNLIAAQLGFKSEAFFELDGEEERATPKVDFGSSNKN